MSFTQDFFTSRNNGANGETQVGQQDRLWYDPDNNVIRVSDGVTPGGIIVSGGGNGGSPGGITNSIQFNNSGNFDGSSNFTFDGTTVVVNGTIDTSNIEISGSANLGNFTISDQTLAGTISNRDIRISPVGNGTVNILTGLDIHAGNYTNNPVFRVKSDGQVIMTVPTVDIEGAVQITGNDTGTSVAPQNIGVMLHTTGQPSTPSRLYNDAVNSYGVLVNRRYNGTSAAPTGVLANQIIGRVGSTPMLADGSWPSISTTRLDFISTQDQTIANRGSQIQMWATADNTANPVIVAQFDPGQILITGNINPNSTTSEYGLGNATNKWNSLYLGPDSLFIEDSVTQLNAEITVANEVLFINGTQRIQIGNMQMTTDGIQHILGTTSEELTIGTAGGTGNTWIKNNGIRFPDDTLQQTAAIPMDYLANAGGVATLGLDGIVPANQLPGGGPVYKGTWNASTNTPTLADGTGSGGDEYAVVVAGTQNLGSGSITFDVGDFVIYNGTVWQKIPGVGSGVTSFNTRTGAVILTNNDVVSALNNNSITNSKLSNANITITTGAGLSGGGIVSLGNSLTLTSTVANILAGTGVNVAISSGNYTVGIGQPVGTGNSVQFLAVTATTTIQATGNVIGGNLSTAGRVVAAGNIETTGNLVTANTTIGAAITSNGNVSLSGANISLGNVANIKITGGTDGQFLTTNGSGDLSWSSVSAANIVGTIANANYAAYAGNVTIAGQGNITSLGTLTGLTSGGTVNLTGASNISLGSNANLHITGGNPGETLVTDGSGNLRWATPLGANTIIQSGANTTVDVDFTYESLHLVYLPTGPVTVNLSNYASGHTARVLVRYATPYTLNTGIANAQQSTDGTIIIPTTGAGGHKINGQQTVQLVYTCFDSTPANCYVATTFL